MTEETKNKLVADAPGQFERKLELKIAALTLRIANLEYAYKEHLNLEAECRLKVAEVLSPRVTV